MRMPPLLLLLQVGELIILSYKNSTLARKYRKCLGKVSSRGDARDGRVGKRRCIFPDDNRNKTIIVIDKAASPDTKERVAEKPPERPGGGTEPVIGAKKSGFAARGRLSPS
ncbi:MAG: hypothetical protein DRP58_05945 [Spirochaetes bacterium]|nr:MAG: hypothetical protein DRP58_05945 [Spirochaetota bacterium]